MKRNLLFILVALLPIVASADLNDTNPTESLYGEWWLVGWNDEGTWFEVDTNYVSHRHLSIEIPTEGPVMAYSIVNEIFVGYLTLNGNEMIFTEGGASTMVYANIEENQFFEDHICKIKSYQLEGNLLRLYYANEDYFVFTNDFDDSEERHYEWKNGPADTYISEVTAMNDEEVEVKIVQCPSYVTSYSRTTPPRTSDICRFATSDLAGLSFEVGDKVAFLITMFKRQKVEKGREYQLKVEPIEGSKQITNRTGKMHNDRRMGWIIIDDKVNGVQGGIYYYPLRKLAEEYLTEGVPVKFSGDLYPAWRTPWDNEGHSDCYYLSIDAINTPQEYYPEGTKWTEIRLDTLKYNSWYSKVDGEWVPNFETIEYYVQGEYTYRDYIYKKVYTNGPDWTESHPLLIYENGTNIEMSVICDYLNVVLWPTEVYQFDWSVGQRLWFQDLFERNSTCMPPCGLFNYGIIDEIKEGDFGGVRPLKYVDLDGKAPVDPQSYRQYSNTNGGRIILGIGITEWNDGECLLGPPNPCMASTLYDNWDFGERHYRSMLVHFERNGEVLYDVWPEKETTEDPVTFTQGQMATIILPTEPDASKGKYYRLDKCEDGEIIFEQELQPQARIPYIIIPNEDFSIDPSTMDLEGLSHDAVSIEGISFIGSYSHEEFNYQEGFYIDIIDTTPDCLDDWFGSGKAIVGPLRAYLQVNWDDPYTQGGTKDPQKVMEIVLKDHGTGINEVQDSKSKIQNESVIFDLSGRRISTFQPFNFSTFPKGVYIFNGKKRMVK